MRLFDRLHAMDVRLLQTGLPLLLSGLMPALLPTIALHYLAAGDYALWAILVSILSATMLLDFGAVPYVLALGYGHDVDVRTVRTAILMACGGALVILLIALSAWAMTDDLARIGAGGQSMGRLMQWMGIGASLRGLLSVAAAVLQLRMQLTARAMALVGQAVVQLVLCWGLLQAGYGLAALPISLILSAGLVAAMAWRAVRRSGSLALDTAPRHDRAISFALSRAAAVMMGIIMTQADRWALTLMGAHDVLRQFDVVNRMAALPAAFTLALLGGLVAEGRRLGAAELAQVVQRMVRRSVGLVALGAVGAALLLGFMAMTGALRVTPMMWLFFAGSLIWYAVNVTTGPISLAFTALGRPLAELRYSVPLIIIVLLGWIYAYATAQPVAGIMIEGIAVIIASLAFLWWGERALGARVDGSSTVRERD